MIGLPVSVISSFSIGITDNRLRYSRLWVASARPSASGVPCEEGGEGE